MSAFTSTALGLLLGSVLLTGCTLEASQMHEQTGPAPVPGKVSPPAQSVAASAPDLLAQAQDALSQGDYQRCASRFAAAAHASSGDQEATCWYRAAQCAARAGDYQESGFHIQAAASAGYANLSRLRADPLLRPLKSGSRWSLIDDAVDKNQIDRSPQEQERTLCQVAVPSYRLEHFDPSF